MKRKITSIFQTQSATLLSPFLLISIFSQLSVGGKNNCYPRSQLQQFGRKKTKSNNDSPGVLTLREKLLKLTGAELPVITHIFFFATKIFNNLKSILEICIVAPNLDQASNPDFARDRLGIINTLVLPQLPTNQTLTFCFLLN